MKLNTGFAGLIATAAILTTPCVASAQRHHHHSSNNSAWGTIALGSAAVGALGLAEHNNTLAVAGLAGAGYSLYRYNADQHSHNKSDQWRHELYSHPTIVHNGHRYVRHSYRKGGQTYYRFDRG